MGGHSIVLWRVRCRAISAPLNGAVVANGCQSRKQSQKARNILTGHRQRVARHGGHRVNAGDTLIVLDDSQARAEFEF